MSSDDLSLTFPCCEGYTGHRYACENREWPSSATPEVRRQAVRGESIGPAHARIEDLALRGLDYRQRKQLTEILARVWDDGCNWGQRDELGPPAPDNGGHGDHEG